MTRVSDIAEFPIANKCRYLNSPNKRTEEQILSALQTNKGLEICKESSYCSGFWHYYKQGQTPFADVEPIRLAHYKGKYWVEEGKKRCCIAMRTGIEYIDADVFESNDRRVLLPPVGKPGEFRFSIKDCSERNIPVLWVSMPNHNGMTELDGKINVLDASFISTFFDTKDTMEIMEGITIKFKKSIIPFVKNRINITVTIDKDHPRTKIWLMKTTKSRCKMKTLCKIKTLYRYGCFRQPDLERVKALP